MAAGRHRLKPVPQPSSRLDRLRAATGTDGAWGIALLVACALLLALASGGEPLQQALRWSRGGIAAGEHWRWVTGHFVHLDLAHAALNAAGLALVWALFARVYTPRRWLLIASLGIAGIDLGLWWLSDIEWYVGLSGLLNTLAAAGIVREIVDGDRMAWVVGLLGLAKLVSENLSGPMPFMQPGIPVVLDAHLYGALVGMVCGLVMRRSTPVATQAAGA
ncbi:MAG: rhombosortase [Gammaproteobacteria bacterium]|nr:rhombosortase [Gammaproteobacteria bacterium]